MPEIPAWITLAHLLRPQGRKGELLAELHTDFPDQLPGRRVYLQRPNAEPYPIEILSQWLPVGRNAGRIVLHLAGVDSISAAESLAGADIVIPAADRLPLTDGSVYISDLIGCTVLDLGPSGDSSPGSSAAHPIGEIVAVDLPTTSDGSTLIPDAAPILTVRAPDGTEHLIPFVQAYLHHLDLPAQRIEMNLPTGLLDISS